MKILLYPKNLLEELWKEDKKQFSAHNAHSLICLRCGRNIYPPIAKNRLSLFAKVNICPYCTAEEISQENEMSLGKSGQSAPLTQWHAVTSGRLEASLPKKEPVLRPVCSFDEIFEGAKKTVYGLERPVCEEIFLRAYYLNGRWHDSWFPCQKSSASPPFMKKLSQFQEALFKMPEFKSLA